MSFILDALKKSESDRQRQSAPALFEVKVAANTVARLALSPETRGLCGEAFFTAMRPGAIFLNAARAEVVDAEALAQIGRAHV